MSRLASLAAILIAAAPAAAQEEASAQEPSAFGVQGRLSLSPTWDSNVHRRSARTGVVADGALVLVGGLDLQWEPVPGQLTTLSWDGGGKLFSAERGADQAANALVAGHELLLADGLSGGVELRLKDRSVRNGDRAYTDLGAGASLQLHPGSFASPRLRAGYRSFVYAPDEAWSASGPWAGISVAIRPWSRHQFNAGYELQLRSFPDGDAFDAAGTPLGPRRDLVHQGQLGWSLRSRFLLSVGYLLAVTDSNSSGFSSLRHQLQAVAGVRLPAELFLNAQASLQYLVFPEGIRFSEDLLFGADDENLSSLSLKLSRPLGGDFTVEVRYQLYLATFARAPIGFERHVAGAGLGWRF